ncbi:tetratricopeptide repeat protein [Streptomyces albus]|uniref:tetratricopeptide repeat protein n=2 Tax=Streptomyces albus TaxID=1888 RepID=UPI003411F6D2
MRSLNVPRLVKALTWAVGNRIAWDGLTEMVQGVADGPGDELDGALECVTQEPENRENVIALAVALLDQAERRSGLLPLLRMWASQCEREFAQASSPAAQVNAVTASVLSGTVVQAREIRGGVHIRPEQPPPVPRQLLPVPADFVDREADIETLERFRAQHAAGTALLIAVTGPAGVGKTALVSRWLKRLEPSYPDGQLYADLGAYSTVGLKRPSDVLGGFLRALGCRQVPAELSEKAALWRSVTAGRRLALMVDNAYSAAQVRPLVPGGEGSMVVVVSRSRLTGLSVDGAAFHALDVLASAASIELLRRRIGSSRVAEDPASARRLAALCAGLPLAVCVAAARVATRPRQSIAVLAGTMAATRDRLETFCVEGDQVITSALDASYRALPLDVARVHRLLGTLPVGVLGTEAAAAACDVSPHDMRRLLDELVEHSLVEEAGHHPAVGARFRQHDLIRAHATGRAEREETAESMTEATRRLVDWYLATATEARVLLSPSHRRLRRDYAFPVAARGFESEASALEWMNAEGPSLMELTRYCSEQGWYAPCWQLVDSMQPWFLRSRPYDLWIEAHVLGLAAAKQTGHVQAANRMLTTGASGLYNAGRLAESQEWFTQALEDARARCDRRAEAQALHGLGQTHRLAGELRRAAELFAAALSMRSAIGYRRGAALSRLCLGDVALAAGHAETARSYLSHARAELQAVGDAYDAARALAFLGCAHAHSTCRSYGTAVRLLRKAFEEFRAVGSVHWQARVLEMLGLAAIEQGDTETARGHFEESLSLYRPLSPQDAERLKGRLRSLSSGQDGE